MLLLIFVVLVIIYVCMVIGCGFDMHKCFWKLNDKTYYIIKIV